MSERMPAVRPEVHYFAGPKGYVFEATYSVNLQGEPGKWALNVWAGALALDVDERAPVLSEAQSFARETWPEAGGVLSLDHKGHRA